MGLNNIYDSITHTHTKKKNAYLAFMFNMFGFIESFTNYLQN